MPVDFGAASNFFPESRGFRPQSPWAPERWFGRGRTCIIGTMLLGLTIRDVVLIDRLDLAFRPGLCVLTGETGAGKSILLMRSACARPRPKPGWYGPGPRKRRCRPSSR
jgi:hypothetical protein